MEFLNSLRVLLKDMCEFLENEVLNSVKTDNAVASKARVLLTTVRTMDNSVQLKIAEDAGGYLEMNLHQPDSYVEADLKQFEIDEAYATANETTSEKDTNISNMNNECPYQNSLVAELQTIKEGGLNRKEVVFAYFHSKRPYYIALIDEWILFYNSNKKGQVLESYNAINVLARSSDEDTGFTMKVEDKSFLMYAGTYKEKMQWVAAINDLMTFKSKLEMSPQKIVEDRPIESSPLKRELPQIPGPEYMNSDSKPDRIQVVPPTLRVTSEILDPYKERSNNPPPRPHTHNVQNKNVPSPTPTPVPAPHVPEEYMLLPGSIAGPEEIYQLLPGQQTVNQEEIYQLITPSMPQASVSPLPPPPRPLPMHSHSTVSPQIVLQEVEEETYADIDMDQEPIYECVDNHMETPFVPPPSPSQVKVTAPLPNKPAVPPSPKQNVLNELKLKQKLSKPNKEAEIENPPVASSSQRRNEKPRKSLSFGSKK